MTDSIQIGKIAPNFVTVGVYKNRLGKIRLSDYKEKKYVILIEKVNLENDMTQQELNQITKKKEEVLVNNNIMKLEI